MDTQLKTDLAEIKNRLDSLESHRRLVDWQVEALRSIVATSMALVLGRMTPAELRALQASVPAATVSKSDETDQARFHQRYGKEVLKQALDLSELLASRGLPSGS